MNKADTMPAHLDFPFGAGLFRRLYEQETKGVLIRVPRFAKEVQASSFLLNASYFKPWLRESELTSKHP